jgi:hypothetical protein
MAEYLSTGAVLNALVVLDAEIKRQKSRFESANLSEYDLEAEGEALLEMEKAFGELVAVYKSRLTQDPSLPELGQILGAEP